MSIKKTYSIGLIIVSLVLLTSLYYQYFEGIMPCPLCTLQRFSFGILGFLFIVGLLLHRSRTGRLIINFLSGLFSIAGIMLAGRQVYLQSFPSEVNTDCGVSLQYMLQALPLHQVAQRIFEGSAECTQRGWEFLRLNMAEWALIFFIILFALTIYLFLQELKQRRF